MKVSVIIPVFNRWDFTEKCLESVFDIGSKYPFEVIVVDNASSDGTREHLEAMAGKITYLRNEENLGFAKACNRGAKEARGEYLLFLNNDTVALPGWLDALVEEMEGDPAIAVVGSKLLYPDGTVQHAGVVFGEDKLPYHIYRRAWRDRPYVNVTRDMSAVTGASLMIRAEVFDRLSGFDEEFLNGYEDIDLCLRVKEKKGRIRYCSTSELYHVESVSDGRFSASQNNRKKFFKRWMKSIEPDDFVVMEKDGLLDTVARVRVLEKRVTRMSAEAHDLRYRLQKAEAEVLFVKSSKFWKLRGTWKKIRKSFFDRKALKRSVLSDDVHYD